MDSHNLASRVGRWSAENWKKAFFGWLLVAFLALVLGTAAGQRVSVLPCKLTMRW
jgi:hypothetical protein